MSREREGMKEERSCNSSGRRLRKGEEPFLFLSDDGRVVDSERQRRKQGDGEGLRSAGYAYAANEAEEIERVAAHGVWPVSNQDVVL